MASGKTKAVPAAKSRTSAQKSAPQTMAAPPSPMLGNLLREAREARELSLGTVAAELMIRQYYLEALENGQYRQLPERVYAVGFVQNYALLLGLDANALVEQFKREAYGGRGAASARMELTMPTPVSQSLMPNRNALFIVASLLVLLVIGGVIWNTRSPQSPEAQIAPPPATSSDTLSSVSNTLPAAPVPDKTSIVSSTGTVTTTNPKTDIPSPDEAPAAPDFAAAVSPAAPTAAKPAAATPAVTTSDAPAPTAPKGTRIMIEAIQPSWVEIADADGNILFTNILRLGQALPIPNKDGITLTTGNAAGVQIVFDGKKLGPLGKTGEVKRALSLDPAKLAPANR